MSSGELVIPDVIIGWRELNMTGDFTQTNHGGIWC